MNEIEDLEQPMTIKRLLEIDEMVQHIINSGEPAVVPNRLLGGFITLKVLQAMKNDPSIPDVLYVIVLISESIPRITARRIVKNARALASDAEIHDAATNNEESLNNHEGEAQ
jgi:hypothetical protein